MYRCHLHHRRHRDFRSRRLENPFLVSRLRVCAQVLQHTLLQLSLLKLVKFGSCLYVRCMYGHPMDLLIDGERRHSTIVVSYWLSISRSFIGAGGAKLKVPSRLCPLEGTRETFH
eukprot:jgi/Botrbrau1/19455/Bobra.0338s0075.1